VPMRSRLLLSACMLRPSGMADGSQAGSAGHPDFESDRSDGLARILLPADEGKGLQFP
jgi:hypothetical protein